MVYFNSIQKHTEIAFFVSFLLSFRSYFRIICSCRQKSKFYQHYGINSNLLNNGFSDSCISFIFHLFLNVSTQRFLPIFHVTLSSMYFHTQCTNNLLSKLLQLYNNHNIFSSNGTFSNDILYPVSSV